MPENIKTEETVKRKSVKRRRAKSSRINSEAPGYGRMSYHDGSMYWSVVLNDDSMTIVNRRELSNEFLKIDNEPISLQVKKSIRDRPFAEIASRTGVLRLDPPQ